MTALHVLDFVARQIGLFMIGYWSAMGLCRLFRRKKRNRLFINSKHSPSKGNVRNRGIINERRTPE